jgi:hypothetical protein
MGRRKKLEERLGRTVSGVLEARANSPVQSAAETASRLDGLRISYQANCDNSVTAGTCAGSRTVKQSCST